MTNSTYDTCHVHHAIRSLFSELLTSGAVRNVGPATLNLNMIKDFLLLFKVLLLLLLRAYSSFCYLFRVVLGIYVSFVGGGAEVRPEVFWRRRTRVIAYIVTYLW